LYGGLLLEGQEEGKGDDAPTIAPLAYGKGKRRRVTSERMRQAALHNAAVDAADAAITALDMATTPTGSSSGGGFFTTPMSPASASGSASSSAGSGSGGPPARRRHYGSVKGVKRGKYRCKECGQLKRGHVCPFPRPGKSVPAKTKAKKAAAAAAAAAAGDMAMLAHVLDVGVGVPGA